MKIKHSRKMHKHDLAREISDVMEYQEIYDPSELFRMMSTKYPFVDYRVIRSAIHEAKSNAVYG